MRTIPVPPYDPSSAAAPQDTLRGEPPSPGTNSLVSTPEPATSPIGNRTSTQNTKPSVFAKPTVFFNGVGYCSLSEAAIGTLLELYVPGFRVIEGETFQVPMGFGRSVDFVIRGVVLEYHQVRLTASRRKLGDFSSRGEYERYRRNLLGAGRNHYRRERIMCDMRERLRVNYYRRRRHLIDQHLPLQGHELVVATSIEEVHHKILRRMNPERAPDLGDLHELFWRLVKTIAYENRRLHRQRKSAA